MSEVTESAQQYDREWFERRGVDDERVINALNEVPRKPFVMIGGDAGESGLLTSVTLPPIDVVGKLLSALELEDDHKVLEIGTDTGYITTLLATLADQVYSVERRPPRAKLAEGRLADLEVENVDVLYGPRLTEYALNAPYDAILLSAIAPRVPSKLKGRLAIGGRMVIPIGEGDANPEVVCIRRVDEETFERTSMGQLRFSAKLGDIFVELGIADRDDIELAALEADASGQRLGEALLEYSHVQESDLVRALAIQRGLKLAPIDELLKIADHELAYSVPRAFLEHHQIVPLLLQDGELTVATVDPDTPAVELARILDADSIDTYLVTSEEFHRIWNTILEGRRRREVDEDNLKARTESKFENILRAATRLQATTIHVDNGPDGGRIRFRVGSELRYVPEAALAPAEVAYLVEFLKLKARLDVLEERIPQRGRFSWVREPVTYHLNIHVMPSVMGEQLSVKLLSHGAKPATLPELGLPEEVIDQLAEIFQRRGGLFIINGPRHAAKKETLYAILAWLASDDTLKVGSVESDILCPIDQVQQVLVHQDKNFGYREAIHEFLRFDADVIGVDEIQSPQLALEALNAGRRGMTVLSTLHGRDAGYVLEGLHEFGIPSEALANGITGILTQQAAPRICGHCRKPVRPEEELLERFFLGGAPADFVSYRGEGCEKCNFTGHDGQVLVLELLAVDEEVRQFVMAQNSGEELRQITNKAHVESMAECAVRLVTDGVIVFEELLNFVD